MDHPQRRITILFMSLGKEIEEPGLIYRGGRSIKFKPDIRSIMYSAGAGRSRRADIHRRGGLASDPVVEMNTAITGSPGITTVDPGRIKNNSIDKTGSISRTKLRSKRRNENQKTIAPI